jgi:type III secretion system YscD/HrpQ family protein
MNEPAMNDFENDNAIELRILHGPQAGSTMPLEPGEPYTLGAADTCAVLLAGSQVEGEHVELTADLKGIQVMPLDGRVMTIDRSEVNPGQTVPLGTALRLGRVKLTIDSVDAPWPHDDALEEPDLIVPEAVQPPAGEDDPVELPGQPEIAAAAIAPKPPRRNLFPSVLLGGAAMLLMGAAVAAWVTSGESESPGADATAPSKVAPVFSAAEGAVPVASSPASAPQVKLMSQAERLNAVTSFAQRQAVPGEVELSVEPSGPGALRIVGAASTQARLNKVIETAGTELAAAGPISFAVLLRSELPQRFEDRLHSADLARKFKVVRREPEMDLQAVLTAHEVRVWEKLFMEFTRQYGTVLTIHAQVRQERDEIEAQIESVVGGAFPYIVTTGGRRVGPGGVLEGRTLAAIRDGEIIFADGSHVRYAY